MSGKASHAPGRTKSDLRLSNTFVYNSFPLPLIGDQRRRPLVSAAAQLIEARAEFAGESPGDLDEVDGIPK